MAKQFLGVSLATLLFAGCSPDAFQSDLLDATISRIQPGASSSQKSDASSPQLSEMVVGSVVLRPQKYLGGKLEILIPADFSQMDAGTINIKYPNQAPPTLVLTNARASVNIAINQTDNPVAPRQLKQLHPHLESAVRQSQPSALWKFNGFQTHHGREWIQLEFRSDAPDTQIHNIIMTTSAGGKMLVVSFNCTEELSGEWLAVGREIVNSCQIQGR